MSSAGRGRSRTRGRYPAHALWVAVALTLVQAPIALADPPDGMITGKWVLAPYVAAGVEVDDNIFRRSSNDPDGIVADQILTTEAGLEAFLPIRQNELKLWYEAQKFDYQNNADNFPRSLDQEIGFRFDARFGTSDRLILSGRHNEAFSIEQVLTDVGEGGVGSGELVFQGRPYDLNHWDLELSRQVFGHAGYHVRLSRLDLNFVDLEDICPPDDPNCGVPFFDYRGWDGAFEYRHPLPSNRWVIGRYNGRRFDHYDPLGEVGEPFRKEVSDNFTFGLRGYLSRKQNFVVRVGWSSFRYDIVDAADVEDYAGHIRWRLALGPRTELDLAATRQTLPSSADTYYINNELRASMDHEWRDDSSVGLSLFYTNNTYGDPELVGCESFGDRRVTVDWDWTFSDRLALDASGSYRTRVTECVDELDRGFDATTFEFGIKAGWY